MIKPPETKARVRERMEQRRIHIDDSNYQYIPESIVTDHYDNEIYLRVAIYARVSSDDPRQTTSYELQKQYYEEFVIKHPKWELVHIYADEGISGTSLKHRDEFLRMIEDAKAGKIDLIITKNVSRFARNVKDFLEMVRLLSEHSPPVGVFFESECIYSLNETSQMALSFQATMAEEESRNKHRSMETSLRMRLDHGLPLTPKLLGFMHDENGKLIINPETAHIPKLMFYMYLYGYSCQQIANALTDIGKITYRGNAKWSSGSVLQVLRKLRTTDLIQRHFSRVCESPCAKGFLARWGARGIRGQGIEGNKQVHDDIIANGAKMSSCTYLGTKNVIIWGYSFIIQGL